MIGIRISEESTMICLRPQFLMNGKTEGVTLPFGSDKLRGSYGVAYSNSGGHTLWFHWKNKCMPRDIQYITQMRARKKAYGFYL